MTIHPNEKSNYHLLNLFKKETEIEKSSPENRPYSFIKPSILLYRIVFLTIGLIYFILAFIILSKSLNWTCSLVFGSAIAVKTTILMVCGGISATSLYFGLFLSTEKETIRRTIGRAKKRLKKLYSHKFGVFGLQRVFQAEDKNEKMSLAYQQFSHLFEKFDHLQIECMHLVEKIAKSDSLNEGQKEELFNQAAIELRFELESLIETFENNHLLV